MSLIMLSHLNKSFGAQKLFSDITLNIDRSEKIGFIGNNGTGKTTLFKIISGIEELDSGEVAISKNAIIGYVPQEMNINNNNTVYEEVSEPFKEFYNLRKKMEALEIKIENSSKNNENIDKELKEYDKLNEKFYKDGIYDFEYQIEWVLNGLQIKEKDWNRKISSFSGGEKNRIGLARELVKKPDVLLLDEPANHLDFDGMEWLEEFIRTYEKTIIIISHNRYLLDMCITKIWSLENYNIKQFKGNYSSYRLNMLEEKLRNRKSFDEDKKKVDRMNFTIQRLKSWGMVYDNPSLIKKARSMQKRKEKIEENMSNEKISLKKMNLSFKSAERSGNIVLELKNYNKRFDEKILFKNAELELFKNDKLALLGPNGSGKTTLLNDIIKFGKWENPDIRTGKNLKIAYYSQMHRTLDHNNTALDEIAGEVSGNEFQAKKVLRNFLFNENDFHKKISALSGGEKARIQLIKLFLSKANFFILDEPTNHLDITSREIVEEALETFDGSILVVSHDRYFIDKVIDRIVTIDNKKLTKIYGNFSSWWQTRRMSSIINKKKKISSSKKNNILNKKNNSQNEEKLKDLEKEIEVFETKKHKLEYEMAKNLNEKGKHHSVQNLKDLKKTTEKLNLLYKKWESLIELI